MFSPNSNSKPKNTDAAPMKTSSRPLLDKTAKIVLEKLSDPALEKSPTLPKSSKSPKSQAPTGEKSPKGVRVCKRTADLAVKPGLEKAAKTVESKRSKPSPEKIETAKSQNDAAPPPAVKVVKAVSGCCTTSQL